MDHFQDLHGPLFSPFFYLKMAIFWIFSSQILTNVPINAILGMYPHNSSSFKVESLILTSKVTKGHLRSSEVNKKRSSEIKNEKNLFGIFLSTSNFFSKSGIFLIRILFLANNISDLKWWAVSAYLIKYKSVNFSIGAINMTNSKNNDFMRKLVWELLIYIKFPYKWYTLPGII